MQACDLTASEARRKIGTKELSPVELLESCLSRVEKVNPPVNGVVAIAYEAARTRAKEAEARVLEGAPLPPLHGLPVGIKDLVETKDLTTTFGSEMFRHNVPEADEALVANLRDKGANIFAKTNTPEHGAGGNTFNPVYGVSGNPFEPSRTCGGSSGGSAIALATGMMPLAHGSDNAGSLRIPASYCGVVGMRPTAGVVASDKRSIGTTHFPVQGPMARTAEDALMMLKAMATSDPRDPLASLVDWSLDRPVDISALKIAISEDLGFAPIEDDLRGTFRERLGAFGSVFRSVDQAHPDMGNVQHVYEVLRASHYIGMYAEKERERPGQWGRLVAQNLEHASRFSIRDVGLALAEQTEIYRRAQAFFQEFDILITPTVGVSPWPKHEVYPATVNGRPMANYFEYVGLTYAITLLNHPAISIPCGVDRHGLPFGIQLVGRRNEDLKLLHIACAVEQVLAESPHTRRPVPDVEALEKNTVRDEMEPVV
ncbi:amidase [Tranquillimonas alkanivorans]|uniref:Asp-tRNAAsn/Glu-tRNAGln amidotransferase A subunit n=1 Tax=Tranquillimonas alkanivorans TaxID=441119 RepID=A0A1I5U8C7_9RHOB|nr:amidase [Tranquillimonas alkanivorans]SFP91187.1 Asp-tRNAAsn/Glu-tRNAGln amidotransferase A subunit [Tranquillimonas alkanivorans]